MAWEYTLKPVKARKPPKDYIIDEPILGFHAWGWAKYRNELRLQSVSGWDHKKAWRVAEKYTARCAHGHRRIPRVDCGCGFWAYDALTPATNHGSIVGAIVGFGRVLKYENGFRCEKAKIVALSYVDDSPYVVKDIAEYYGVPLVRREDLMALGKEWGRTYPWIEPPMVRLKPTQIDKVDWSPPREDGSGVLMSPISVNEPSPILHLCSSGGAVLGLVPGTICPNCNWIAK